MSSDLSQHAAIPEHVAIIMDGNNRWAKQRRLPGVAGHRAGVEAIRKLLSACQAQGVKALTLFAFSSENWQRSSDEVGAFMALLLSYLSREVDSLHGRGVRLRFIGRRDRLSSEIVEKMEQAERLTQSNTVSTLVLAVDYGGQWDIATAARSLAGKVADGELALDAIDELTLAAELSIADLTPPDLCIRTGGDCRISNFLLWQLSYAELYFTDCYWPDFDEQEMARAIADFSLRQRRFGKNTDRLAI